MLVGAGILSQFFPLISQAALSIYFRGSRANIRYQNDMSEPESEQSQQDKGLEEYVEDGKNKCVIKCKFCGSKMLEKNTAAFVTEEKELPLMQQDTRKEGEVQNETVKEFFHVENMYTFENIGFTHTVGNTKYLSCADCDAGPVGYYNMDTKHCFVALCRVVQSV